MISKLNLASASDNALLGRTCLAKVLDKLCQCVPFGGVHMDVVLVSNELIVHILSRDSGARMGPPHKLHKVSLKLLRVALDNAF